MKFPGADLFNLYDAHGLPLAEALRLAREAGFLLDLPGFVLAAKAGGWTEARCIATTHMAFADGLGYSQNGLKLLDVLVQRTWSEA